MRTHANFTAAELRRFERLLLEERHDAFLAMGRMDETLSGVLDARNSGTDDDEHDPDGPTLTMEWSRMSGVHSELVAKSAAIDRALSRIHEGTYGLCVRRGELISRERLEARPAAELCIDCAREVEAGARP